MKEQKVSGPKAYFESFSLLSVVLGGHFNCRRVETFGDGAFYDENESFQSFACFGINSLLSCRVNIVGNLLRCNIFVP